MNLPLLLYNFVKIYVPGAFLLCLIYVATNHIPQHETPVPDQPKKRASLQQKSYPKPLPTVQTKVDQRLKKRDIPSYSYTIELSSGGSMKAKSYKVKGNIVTIIIDDGYEVQLSRNDVKSIKRFGL